MWPGLWMVLKVIFPKEKAALVFQVLISLDGKLTFVIWMDYQRHAEGVLEGLGAIDVVEVGVSE